MKKTKAQIIEEMDALKAQLKDAEHEYEEFAADVEVTVGMLAYNAWPYLPFVMPALVKQGVRLDVMTYVDRSSSDLTRVDLSAPEMKTALEQHESGAIREYRYLGELPHLPMEQILALSKGNITFEANTPYIFFLDADVLLPDNAIRDALVDLKSDASLGGVCVPYNYYQGHPMQGGLLMRKEVARESKFQHTERCVCRNLSRKLEGLGLGLKHWKRKKMAEHLKWTSHCPEPEEVQDGDLG
jgi:hypothetical protein